MSALFLASKKLQFSFSIVHILYNNSSIIANLSSKSTTVIP